MKKSEIENLIKMVIVEQLSNSKALIIESMNVQVVGANYQRIDNLHSLSTHLTNVVISSIVHKMPKDQQDYFKKNGVGFYETIVPDGDYYQGPDSNKGVLNLYISGFTSDTLKEVLESLFIELRKLKISWGIIKKDQSKIYKSQVIRIPITKNENIHSGPPELNLANRNAYHIFHKILQYEGENSFSMDVKELKERIESLSSDKGWVTKHIIPTKEYEPKPPTETDEEWKDDQETEKSDEDPNPHDDIMKGVSNSLNAKMISAGLNEEDLWKRLQRILEICDWAIKNGYDKIVVN